MNELLNIMPALLLATLAGYLLGAIPLAQLISRWRGVDIFSTGTRLAGSSNVRLSVGKLPGLVVLVGDIGKGGSAVLAAEYIGINGAWIICPIAAAVFGHWKSVFSRFRGGDGVATLSGATIAIFPVIGMISVLAGMIVALVAQRLPLPSLFSVVFGYATLLALVIVYEGNAVLTMGIGALSGLVLIYAFNGHRLRRQFANEKRPEVERITDQAQIPIR